jgi:hypothetical protein
MKCKFNEMEIKIDEMEITSWQENPSSPYADS